MQLRAIACNSCSSRDKQKQKLKATINIGCSVPTSLYILLILCHPEFFDALCYFAKSCDITPCHCIDMQELFAHFQITAFRPLALCSPALLCVTVFCLLCDALWCSVISCVTLLPKHHRGKSFLATSAKNWALLGSWFHTPL